MWSFAAIEGNTEVRSKPYSFVMAFKQRIEAGLLAAQPNQRSQYRVTGIGPDRLEFEAANWATAVAVGLNHVDLRSALPGLVSYTVRYPRWAQYVAGFSAVIATVFMVFFLTFDLRHYLATHPASSLGQPPETTIAIGWATVLFWGYVWPWILIAIHKGSLRRLIERLIHEVDREALEQPYESVPTTR